MFEELYEIAINNNIIDDVLIEENTFIDVLTTPRIDETLDMQFKAANYIVAKYLDSISVFFEKFDGTAIEASKMFLNKSRKPITAQDLYSAKSRTPEKAKSKLEKIDSEIKALEKKYL